MLFLISLFFNLVSTHSLYAGPGTDTVLQDGAAAYEILGKVAKPKNLKNIKEKKYTNEIPETSYPYWSHSADASRESDLCTENNRIQADFGKIDATEADMYYHPVGLKQFNGNETMIANADRVKARFTVNNIYGDFHITPFYAVPGELITIEFASEEAKNSLRLYLNHHTVDFDCSYIKSYQRINKIQKEYRLTNKVNKIVWPYGGQLSFRWLGRDAYPEWNYPIDVTVSGVILGSMFVYGVTDDAEFEKQLVERAGPVLSFDTGCTQGQGAHTYMLEVPDKRTSDCMRLMRTRFQIAQFTARDQTSYGNPQFGRVRHPNLWFFDSYMYQGAGAYADINSNFCGFNLLTMRSTFEYQSHLRGNWGVNHEQNHHHQQNWGISKTDEVTNNVINLVTYAMAAETNSRNDFGNGKVGNGGASGEDHTHQFYNLCGEHDNYLSFWAIMLHQFGVKKFQEFIKSDQQDLLYKKSEYGKEGAELLRAGKLFGYNMIHHWNFHQISNSSISSKAFKELETMNLPFFHPVVNFYASGYVRDGEEFETIHPLEVPGEFKSVFEFNKYFKSREEIGGKELWGHFEFVRLEGRKGGWKELSKGTYEYTPPSDVHTIDRFYLIYKDTTTDMECKLLGTFKLKYGYIEVIRYDDVLEEDGNTFTNVTKAYETAAKREISGRYSSPSFGTANYNSDKMAYITVARGKFKVPADGNYTFYLKDDDKGMLYISEDELKYNPVSDKAALHISSNRELTSYSNSYKSENLSMTTNKEYNIAIVCYNTGGAGYAQAGVKLNTEEKPIDIPISWMANQKVLTEEDKLKLAYVPKWHEIPYLNNYTGMTTLDIDSSNFKIVSVPPPEDRGTDPYIIFNPSTELTSIYFSQWFSNTIAFPHNYDISFEQEIEFDYIKLITCTKKEFDMDSDIEIYLASTTDDLGKDSNLIYTGNYSSHHPEILLNKEHKGKFLRISFLNNRIIWVVYNGEKTGSDIAYLAVGKKISKNLKFVIPATHTKINAPGSVLSIASIGYNGKVLVVPNSGTMEYTFPKGVHEFMVIGDKYNGMGSGNVYINGKKVAEIDRYIYMEDQISMKYSTRSYRSPLFVSDLINENATNTLKIEVTNGQIAIAGFVVDIDPELISPSEDNGGNNGGSNSDSKSNGKSKTGAIVGGIFGVLIAGAIIAGVAVYFLKFRKPKNDASSTAIGQSALTRKFDV